MLQHQIGTNETAGLYISLPMTHLSPASTGGTVVEVLAIQTHSRLESETVSGTRNRSVQLKLMRENLRLRRFLRDAQRSAGVECYHWPTRELENEGVYLKAILACVPVPRNVQIEPLKSHKRRPLKRQHLQVLGRLGTLQSQQPHHSRISISTFSFSLLLLSLFHSFTF